MAKFCSNCGHPLEGAGAFCSFCGAPLQPAPQQQAAARQQQQAAPLQPAPRQQAAPPRQPAQPPAGGGWSPPRGAPQQEARPWQQPTAANEWHPAPGSAAGAWTAAQPAARFGTAAQVMQAWENRQDARYPQPAGASYGGVPAPGWSSRINDPELLAALAKQKKASRRLSAILIPFPLAGFAVYGLVSDSMELGQALLYGAIISAVFLIFALIGKRKSSPKGAYEGVVVDKQTRLRQRRNADGDGGHSVSTYNELITVARTDAGEQKKITERDDNRTLAWDYLQIGARFRYHPEHAFPYELYDKSQAPFLRCVVCQKKNPVAADRCSKCGAPLLK